MDKVEKVNIGGFAFTLEENACAAAQAYLGELEQFYGRRPGGREILEGIEERFAELLLEKTGSAGVASRSDIDGVIAVLGRPDVLERDAEEYGADVPPAAAQAAGEKPRHRLYRDVSNKMIGGVCSGLAGYFKLDVAVVRIAAALLLALTLFGGWSGDSATLSFSAVLLYFLLWICIPAAKTVRQRWELRGESGTVDEVSRLVENGIREVGDFAGSVARSTAAHRLGRAFLVVIGLMLIAIGVTGLTAVGVTLFSRNLLGLGEVYGEAMWHIGEYSPQMVALLSTPWVRILLLLALTLPFIGMLYAGLQLVFGFPSPKWHPGLLIFILWLIIVIVLCVLAIGCAVSGDPWLFWW